MARVVLEDRKLEMRNVSLSRFSGVRAELGPPGIRQHLDVQLPRIDMPLANTADDLAQAASNRRAVAPIARAAKQRVSA